MSFVLEVEARQSAHVRYGTGTDPEDRAPGSQLLPGAGERQAAEVASCLWSEPTLTSMRRGFACSATGMATVNTPPS